MKVRISYGVELDEVPSMVADMVNQAAAELEQMVAELRSSAGMLGVDNSMMQNGAIQMMHHVRAKISESDALLNDAQGIMVGYINAMEEKHNPPPPQPQPEAQPAPVPPPPPSPVRAEEPEDV